MSCTQLVTPNLDPVIYQSGHMLTDWYAWCLAYVQTAFGTGWAGSNATEAWNDHIPDGAKHLNKEIPSGMYVPIYFSGYHGLGHFGIYKDGYVWCTPIEHKPTADVWDSISTVEHKYGVTYVGWTEMLGGTQVVEYTPDVTIEPTPPQPTYQVTETYPDGKLIQLNKQPTNLWGMNYDFDYMKDHPVEVHNQGEVWTIADKVHHLDGYDYYRREGQVDGFNILDCDDYVVPPPPPPAAPVTATPAETYTLVQKIPTYPTYVDALARTSVGGPLYQGIYYVWGTNGRAKQLGPDNMHEPTGNWVNTDDNIITVPDSTRLDPPPMDTPAPNPVGEPPATANWRGTINLAFAGMYVFWNHNHTHDPHALTVKVLDLETGQPVTKDGLALTPDNGQYAQFSGKVRWTDGNWYGRLKDTSSQFKWYAVPIEDLLPYNDVYGSRTTLEEREYLHTLTAADKIELWLAKVGTLGRNIFDIVKPKEKKK